jgi:hypothetical protein
MGNSSLILVMHTSADGDVSTTSGALWPAFGWPEQAQRFVNELYRDSRAIIFGRGVYDTVVPFWMRVAREGIPEGVNLGEVDLEYARLFRSSPSSLCLATLTASRTV